MADQSITYIDSDQIPNDGVLFKADPFDALLRANGATLVHYKAVRCPIGLTDPMSDSRTHDDHDTCSNGHIYIYAGEVTVSFTNNSMRNSIRDYGETEQGTVAVTLPRFYDNTETEVLVATYDRFYYKDDIGYIETEDTIEASRTGIDRLLFPIIKIEYLIDANGKQYTESDFSIQNGVIKWLGTNRPGYDPKLNKGVVFSCRYRIKPFFYVKSLVHEIRIAKKIVDGKAISQRMPYAVMLQREIAFQSQTNDPNTPSNLRKQSAPRSGSFGPR